MCNCCCHKQIIKRGRLYTDIKSKLRPLDLLAFKGSCFVSSVISDLEKRGKSYTHGGDFTHVGMIINNEVIDDPSLKNGKLYVLESTMGGILGSGVKNIYGKVCLGVQIRDLDEVINAYDKPDETHIAWCPLTNNPYISNDKTMIKTKLTELYNQISGAMWNYNCWDLLSSLYYWMRCCRPCCNRTFNTGSWLFCSQMVALCYKTLGILPSYVNPPDVVPADLVFPHEDTDKMPMIISEIVYITTPSHYEPIHSDQCSTKHPTSFPTNICI